MTRDEIISMFHEAGEAAGWKPGVGNKLVINYLTHFAALVAAAEREACAKVCDPEPSPQNEAYIVRNNKATMRRCATAIRARSST